MRSKAPMASKGRSWGHLTPEERRIGNTVYQNFFSSFDKDWYLSPLRDAAGKLPGTYKSAGEAFVGNIDALIAVVALPITFASNRASDMRFQQLLMAERIRKIPLEVSEGECSGDMSPELEEAALESTRKKFSDEFESTDGLRSLAFQAYRYLTSSLENEEFRTASIELLLQGAVLAWGAVEVLSRDIFMAHVNAHPEVSQELATHPNTKGRFSLKSIDLSELAAHRFDLSQSMGTFLLSGSDFSDLATIKDRRLRST
ncbi:MAG: hypothetical protein HY067_03465 [Betaproteobacteria bacterium]|nr:hypothetical protein [Betaproteobacteria bacterium]